MAELSQARCICRFEHDGRQFGAIRNFRKYQRPKKPNRRFFVPPELRTWVCLSEAGTEPSGVQDRPVSPKSEPAAQMEEEGGRRDDEGGRRKDVGGKRKDEGGKRKDEGGRGKKKPKDLPPESDDVDNAAAAEISRKIEQKGSHAFVSGVIKLAQQDLDQWKKAFPNLSLEAELLALSEWAQLRPNWFSAVSSALAKKQRAAVLALERVKAEATANGKGSSRNPNHLWDRAL
ncbi:MAG: hypothetical protein ACLPKB_25620 [Xanthobacteraceae bacterium]